MYHNIYTFLVHCNIKQEGILIFNDNGMYSVRLADFGISKLLNAQTVVSTVEIPGTPAGMAPEIQSGNKEHVRIILNFQFNFTH